MIYINKHIDVFPGANTRDIVFETELDEMFLNSMPKILSTQEYVQWFDCEYITKKYGNTFECIYTAESIYEGVVKPSY